MAQFHESVVRAWIHVVGGLMVVTAAAHPGSCGGWNDSSASCSMRLRTRGSGLAVPATGDRLRLQPRFRLGTAADLVNLPSETRGLASAVQRGQIQAAGGSGRPLPAELQTFIDKPISEGSMRGIAITPIAGTADTILLRLLTGEIKSERQGGLSKTTPVEMFGLTKEQRQQLCHPTEWPTIAGRIKRRKKLKGATRLEAIDNIGSEERSLLEAVLSESQKHTAMCMQLSIERLMALRRPRLAKHVGIGGTQPDRIRSLANKFLEKAQKLYAADFALKGPQVELGKKYERELRELSRQLDVAIVKELDSRQIGVLVGMIKRCVNDEP